MAKLKIGDKAPAFTLFSSDKEEVSLKDLEGRKVLLLFFPLAFTSTCTTELCGIRDNLAYYNGVGAEVFGISVDSPQTLKRYKEDQSLNFTLLSDFNKEASVDYDALYEVFSLGMRGVSKRAAFVIDGKGVIQYAEVLDNAGELPNFAAIKETLESIEVEQD